MKNIFLHFLKKHSKGKSLSYLEWLIIFIFLGLLISLIIISNSI